MVDSASEYEQFLESLELLRHRMNNEMLLYNTVHHILNPDDIESRGEEIIWKIKNGRY